jgi:kynurenine formamidase
MDITALSHGIVGRGVLLDLPRQFGVKWLEPGHAVTTEELEAAEKAQGVRLTEGDILLFRTGHSLRRIELGSWNNGYDGEGQAGLHATAIRMLHDRKVAAMGMVCADSLQFEELVGVCEEHGRWEFLVCAAPLRIPSGTGSPFNPIAVL